MAVARVDVDDSLSCPVFFPDHRSIRSYGLIDILLWPNGEIPYRMDATFSDAAKRRIRAGMDVWEKHTCVR